MPSVKHIMLTGISLTLWLISNASATSFPIIDLSKDEEINNAIVIGNALPVREVVDKTYYTYDINTVFNLNHCSGTPFDQSGLGANTYSGMLQGYFGSTHGLTGAVLGPTVDYAQALYVLQNDPDLKQEADTCCRAISSGLTGWSGLLGNVQYAAYSLTQGILSTAYTEELICVYEGPSPL